MGMTFGIVLIEVLVILLFHVWHGLESSDRQLQVGKRRAMQDLLSLLPLFKHRCKGGMKQKRK